VSDLVDVPLAATDGHVIVAADGRGDVFTRAAGTADPDVAVRVLRRMTADEVVALPLIEIDGCAFVTLGTARSEVHGSIKFSEVHVR
jgi:hypothetical protein